MTGGPERALVAFGALAGGFGVVLAAAAAHAAAGPNLETSSRFLMLHAPALIGLAAVLAHGLVQRRIGILAGAGLVLGLALFCGDLAWRALVGSSPVRLAAPAGGVLLIGGWALVCLAALLGGEAARR